MKYTVPKTRVENWSVIYSKYTDLPHWKCTVNFVLPNWNLFGHAYVEVGQKMTHDRLLF